MSDRGYSYGDAELNASHDYLLPKVRAELSRVVFSVAERKVFDLGCGNGSVARYLTNLGYRVTGVDPSAEGIEAAHRHEPGLDLFHGSAYDPLRDKYGTFDAVVSLEVVEHLYYPRKWATCLYELLNPRGTAIVSTPFHGYWKNLAMAVTGQLDRHFTALWDHGHIKFFSEHTLGTLLAEAGFRSVEFSRVGRIRPLAKSMIAVARK